MCVLRCVCPLQVALLSSSASNYPHRAVQLLVLEIQVRYYRFFLTNPSYLPGALGVFLDERGLYNTNAVVRAKACYLLLRFVKHTLKASSPAVLDAIISRGCSSCCAKRLATRA